MWNQKCFSIYFIILLKINTLNKLFIELQELYVAINHHLIHLLARLFEIS